MGLEYRIYLLQSTVRSNDNLWPLCTNDYIPYLCPVAIVIIRSYIVNNMFNGTSKGLGN